MPSDILVCFAVKEEARAFEQTRSARPRATILVTGMGKRNAEKTINGAIQHTHPSLVLTSGFAGALNPKLMRGTVVFENAGAALESSLLATGAVRSIFHCTDRVVATATGKLALRQSTGADAVEMESQIISSVCKSAGIPCVTVRVILDQANEDLPLDFNQFMTDDLQMSYTKLVRALWRNPGKVRALMEFQKQCKAAARELALALVKVIPE